MENIVKELKEKYEEGVEITYMEKGDTFNVSIIVKKHENDYVSGDIGVSRNTLHEDAILAISSFVDELINS